jgi:putative flippase GtrA
MAKSKFIFLRNVYRRTNVRQIIRYGVVGVVNVSIEYTVFNVAYYAVERSTIVANTWAIGIAMFSGFLLHHGFTFKNSFYSWRQTSRYIGVVALGGILNYAILMLLLQVIPHAYIAKMIQIVLLSVYNFTMYKHFVYINKN